MDFPLQFQISFDSTLQFSPGPVSCECEPNQGPEKEDDTLNPSPTVDLNSLLFAQLAQQANVFTSELNLAYRRQGDAIQIRNSVIDSVVTGEILRGDDPMQIAGLNAGVRTPTTIDHPSAVVGK